MPAVSPENADVSRMAAILAAALACLAVGIPSLAFAQDSDTLWVETFTNRAFDRPWSEQTGDWSVFFTDVRAFCTTHRLSIFYEASMTTSGSGGETPILDWTSVSLVKASALGGVPASIVAVRHNVTGAREGYGLELSFASGSADQIRIVRYLENYGMVTPALATVDTTLDTATFYEMKFSVLHTQTGVSLKGKVWPQFDEEPAAWNIETLSPFVLIGSEFGLGAVGTSTTASATFGNVIVLGPQAAIEPTTWGRVKKQFR